MLCRSGSRLTIAFGRREPALRQLHVGILLLPTTASGDVIIGVTEVGGNVRFDYSGSLDLSGLAFGTGGFFGGNNGLLGSDDSLLKQVVVASPGLRRYSAPFASTGGDWISTSILASSGSGNHIFVSNSDANPLRLHAADFAGDVWSGSGFIQFDSRTIATMPIDLSIDRVWTIDNMAADTITITTNPVSTAVPEPSSLAILAVGATGFGVWRRRRTRVT